MTPCVTCPSCGGRRSDSRRDGVCRDCARSADAERIGSLTLGQLRQSLSLNAYHAKIRGWSRATYQGPRACLVCGYSLHVDVCHRRPVADFPSVATISDVNDPSNLVALCKNHHWEFDNGHLSLT